MRSRRLIRSLAVASLATGLGAALAVPASATGHVTAHHARTATAGSSAKAVPTAARRGPLTWRHRDVPTDQRLRGLAVVDARHAWVTGSAGGVWKTHDGGRTWRPVSPPGAGALLFRDVEATDMQHAQVLAIGEGTDSRIYRTTDGGRTWRATFVNHDPAAFYDCMAMWPGGVHGIALSDPVDGKFGIIATDDRGRSWHRVSSAGMPAAAVNEYGFAASGTCLVTAGHHRAYLASGGSRARVFVSRDRGRDWVARRSTLPASNAEGAGVFSLAFRTPRLGLAVGGNLSHDTDGNGFAAFTRSGGRHWTNGGDLGGYRSGVAWRWVDRKVAVAVGPTGSDITRDGGVTWRTFDTGSLDAVQCVQGACWASGDLGAVAHLRRS